MRNVQGNQFNNNRGNQRGYTNSNRGRQQSGVNTGFYPQYSSNALYTQSEGLLPQNPEAVPFVPCDDHVNIPDTRYPPPTFQNPTPSPAPSVTQPNPSIIFQQPGPSFPKNG